jgi:DNA-binding CsgD family transcriptional regulator
MAKVESIRLVPRRFPGGTGPVNGNGAGLAEAYESDSDALLELLAAGDPPAFATDSRDRIVFWNRGMTDLVGRRSEETLGHRCYDTVAGQDVFGNRFCYANCPVMATLREGGHVRGFELKVATSGGAPRPVSVTILKISGARPDLFTVVHILQPIAEEGRFAGLLERLAPRNEDGRPLSLRTAAGEGGPPLTRREAEILHHVAAGLQNKEVAQKLDISLATVRNHIHNMLDKLGVHSKLEAVSLSFRSGWVSAGAKPSHADPDSRPLSVGAEES